MSRVPQYDRATHQRMDSSHDMYYLSHYHGYVQDQLMDREVDSRQQQSYQPESDEYGFHLDHPGFGRQRGNGPPGSSAHRYPPGISAHTIHEKQVAEMMSRMNTLTMDLSPRRPIQDSREDLGPATEQTTQKAENPTSTHQEDIVITASIQDSADKGTQAGFEANQATDRTVVDQEDLEHEVSCQATYRA